MERRTGKFRTATAVLGVALWLTSGQARAQFGIVGGPPPGIAGVGSSGGATPFGGAAVNWLMNPLMNPYVNPYGGTAQQQMTAGSAALYFLAAQRAGGGIGSGRLGGPQAAQATQGPGRAPARGGRGAVATTAAPRRGGANVPGAGASHYFDRDYPTNLSTTGYYSRPNPHFPYPGK
jgi:hypothetical protein